MSAVDQGRFTSEIDGDHVVFIIGARPSPRELIRHLRDLGGKRGMNPMRDCLVEHPDKGCGATSERGRPSPAAWRGFVTRVGKSGRTGFRCETFLLHAGEFEAVCANLPDFGLATASPAVPTADSIDARSRLKSTGGDQGAGRASPG